jgi:gamma-glutamylcyclotransferase (GGCT)/AIG2-like uncharacterized protein YtfP
LKKYFVSEEPLLLAEAFAIKPPRYWEGGSQMSDSMSLFVFGSFTQGMIHRTKIDQYVNHCEPAKLEAYCFLLPVGYPVITEESSVIQAGVCKTWITGELLRLSAPQVIFTLLDEFHGVASLQPEKGLHFKKEVKVDTNAGLQLATAYYMNPAKVPREARPITDGDWSAAMKGVRPVTEGLNSRQIEYLRKLGGVKGRSLIPYDLNLSRELMKLDLIVDKGRRLALTKLGKEVLRYIPE